MRDCLLCFQCCYEIKQVTTRAERVNGECSDCGATELCYKFTQAVIDRQNNEIGGP